ncbi:hypothetical protein [Sphingomonas sp.]|uniref:hypothetical protein n=1 Tax=Sphingomonas sp. TaxID=28214 RepID=UPI003B3AA68E
MAKRGFAMLAATALLAGGCRAPGGLPTPTSGAVIAGGLRAAELAFAAAAGAAETAVDNKLMTRSAAARAAADLLRGHAALMAGRAAVMASGVAQGEGDQRLAAANDALAARVVAKLAAVEG